MPEEIQKTEEAAVEAKDTENTVSEAKQEKAVEAAPKPKKMRNTIENVEEALLAEGKSSAAKFPAFESGDTVKVYVKIVEGDKQRLQPFEGVVMAIRHGGIRKSFMVRKISHNVAIERVFPFHSPYVEKVEIIRKGRVRRAKLYYLRGRFGRSAVVTEKV
jgi:large subunit ribosomal protein L19